MLSDTQRSQLVDVAWQSVHYGLSNGCPMQVDENAFDNVLTTPGASFVTLHRHGQLRGCIGSLEVHQPLVTNVAQNAFSSAFRDPRFPSLAKEELEELTLDISVLGKPEAMTFLSEQDLISQLRPGIDGLILEDDGQRGTFLPTVWESLPHPAEFLQQLKRKAGLSEQHWSGSIKVWRYTTECFGGDPFSAL